MQQRVDPDRRGMPVAVGVALLAAATATTLPVARWGDSAVVLLVVPAAVAGYVAGRRLPTLAPAVLTFTLMLAALLPTSFLLPDGAPLGDWLVSVLIALLAVVAPWWVGRYRFLRAEQRESDAAVLAERAQEEERARIADDLHDTIGHELALIAVQAGALELSPELAHDQREQFRELREAAVRASGRLRDVVRMTRPDGPSRLTPAGGVDLDALVAGARDAGMTVRAELDRRVLAEAHPLLAELAARTLREGLTNSARHAAGAAVDVELVADPGGGFILSVRSAAMPEPGTLDAPAHAEVLGGPGAGHGIPSLRRRADALGASLDAGPADDGFLLRLHAPARPAPTGSRAAEPADPALRSNARAVRRRALQASVVPGLILALALAGFVVVQAVTVTQTAISSATYDRIDLGTPRSELSGVLPAGLPAPAPVVAEPSAPDGADCEYYAARDGWLHFTDATYRLCFREGVLVEKTALGEAP
ncbi:histidine kinase [Agromyces sp. G08B096]|uniref:histidine kinase n=1 Tax=Agromyces sp. G08B096 TaxID=3156399 RepID=A0AAU7W6E5_9MICO